MKNVAYLIVAMLFFGLAYYAYWLVTEDNSAVMSTRRGVGPRPFDLEMLIKHYQPYLTLASSLGGIASFFFQVRVWMRGRA